MSQPDKPEGAKVGWRVRETAYPFANPWTTLRQDRVMVEGQDEITFTYQERPPAVIIVPVTTRGEVVLIRQYRYPVDDWCLEVPAGGTHDTGDAELEDVARKELQEEIGGTCAALENIGFFYSNPALTDEKCYVFLATGVELAQDPQEEKTENIEIRPTPIAEALQLARHGQVRTAPSALALLLCEDRLRQSL